MSEAGVRWRSHGHTERSEPRNRPLTTDSYQFWIDVGGTFTDCIARAPDGRLTTCKTLSSGSTKGRVESTSGASIHDPLRAGDPNGFWVGYEARFGDEQGRTFARTTVVDSTPDGRLELETLPAGDLDGTSYELVSGEEAPIVAVRRVLGLRLDQPIPPVVLKLGTTRGTNALLERKGARTALVTTKGFGDVLLVGNQDRPRLFDLAIEKPEPIFEAAVEIDERLDANGRVLRAPDEAVVRRRLQELHAAGVESLGICLLHAYANGEHEQVVERIARDVGFTEVSVSHRVAPLVKLVSRGDTTVMDAYLNPVLREYVGRLRQSLGGESRVESRESRAQSPLPAGGRGFGRGGGRLSASPPASPSPQPSPLGGEGAAGGDVDPPSPVLDTRSSEPSTLDSQPSTLKVMTSAGGLVDAAHFVGKDSVLSGPAGGVIGFSRVAERAGFGRAIGFDMGGTSTDVARYDGEYEREFETTKAGVRVVAPMLAIETVAAGGGSLCGFDGVKLHVGPESAGADPGPACYGRGGPLTVTDVNVFLGKVLPSRFPFPLDRDAVERRLAELCDAIADSPLGRRYTPVELAEGYVEIANANMARAIGRISVAKGYDPAEYVLVTFGGAGAQHACAIAASLGMSKVLIHPFAGILSAYGIGLADVRRQGERSVLRQMDEAALADLAGVFAELESSATAEVRAEDVPDERIDPPRRSLELRYHGTESPILVPEPDDGDWRRDFERRHQQLYGYVHSGKPVEVVTARVEVVGRMPVAEEESRPVEPRVPEPSEQTTVWFGGASHAAGVFLREQLRPGDELAGPCIVCEPTSTIVVDPGWEARVRERGEVELRIVDCGLRNEEQTSSAVSLNSQLSTLNQPDPVRLEIFNNLFASIAEQMGLVLQRTAFSTNVKERLDFSCAVFDPDGGLVVNAPHIPVHLGAMGETVRRVVADNADIVPGDVFVTNDPYRGGSHLPDVTVVTPVFVDCGSRISDFGLVESGNPQSAIRNPQFFVASRAHHAEIGGIVPGSMPPFSRNLGEEGVLIRNVRLVAAGESREEAFRELLESGSYPTRNVEDNLADVAAQVAANAEGARQLLELVERHDLPVVQAYMGHVQQAAAEKMRLALAELPDGRYEFEDHLDDGSPVRVAVTIDGNEAVVDFTGTGPVLSTNLNANRAIVTAAVLYVFRCLIAEDIPLNDGVLEPVEIVLPECLLNPPERECPEDCPAVVGGNVETSQRVVDVLLGALGLAAASQGTMNNLVFGDERFGYYETICGGSGATADRDGADAVHTHMTNTRLTDPEIVERRYSVRLHEFAIRRGSGGAGERRGGDGVVREIEFLEPLEVSMLSERRGPFAPFGLAGGSPGQLGRNTLRRAGSGEVEDLGGKFAISVNPGDVLRIETPGGGGVWPIENENGETS